MMNDYDRLISLLTQYDRTAYSAPPSRLALLFEAAARAKAHPKGLEAGVREEFNIESPPVRRFLAGKSTLRGK